MPKRYRPADVAKVLRYDGWSERKGKGDHVNFTKPRHRWVVTVDMGAREIPAGTMKSMLRQVGMSRKQFDEIAREVL